MNREQAIAALKGNPFPGTDLAEAVDYCYRYPEPDWIPLLIQAFDEAELQLGEGIQTALCGYPSERVVPHLAAGMHSPIPRVRGWCADTVKYFPHADLLPGLENMLGENDIENRLEAITGLGCLLVEHEYVKDLLRVAWIKEEDDGVRDLIEEVLQ